MEQIFATTLQSWQTWRTPSPAFCARCVSAALAPAPLATVYVCPALYDCLCVGHVQDIASLEEYKPVKPLDVLAAEIGVAVSDLVKLDANENLYGPVEEVHIYLQQWLLATHRGLALRTARRCRVMQVTAARVLLCGPWCAKDVPLTHPRPSRLLHNCCSPYNSMKIASSACGPR
jgi:hypothetical protein